MTSDADQALGSTAWSYSPEGGRRLVQLRAEFPEDAVSAAKVDAAARALGAWNLGESVRVVRSEGHGPTLEIPLASTALVPVVNVWGLCLAQASQGQERLVMEALLLD